MKTFLECLYQAAIENNQPLLVDHLLIPADALDTITKAAEIYRKQSEPLPIKGSAKSFCLDRSRKKDWICKYPIGSCEDCKYGL